MSWIKLGVRWQPIYHKSKKLLAWSVGLKEEVGLGYSKFIATNDGSQFVDDQEQKDLKQKISRLDVFEYIAKTDYSNEQILEGLKGKADFNELLNLSIKQLTYFYIANEAAEISFSNLGSQQKSRVEKWRNNRNLFRGDDQMFTDLAKQLGISSNLLEYMTIDEVKQKLGGQMIDMEKVKLRKSKKWSLVLENGIINLYLKDLSPTEERNRHQIKGKSVFESNQKIIGVVGEDILVTSMTHPDMVSKMKRMKAIITDEGGVLSHAAITCREFQIPGIIGTKVATKFLKKKMRVEVDIKKGLVTIL